MLFIRLFRFLSGYIIFTCKNGFPERFLNLCAYNGINVWDAKVHNGLLEAKTNISGIKNIQQCAKKSGMSLRIVKECGLPFIIKPYLERKGLAVGIVISVLITVLLSSTVWTVEVNGNYKFTAQQVIELAEAYGIYPGAFRSRIDQDFIKNEIKAKHDGINWFAVNIDGSAVSLDLLEISDDRTEDDPNQSLPCNIISGVDGEILKLDIYAGDAATRVGSAVTNGDLLISGVKEKQDGSVEFVHAKGQAVIRTKKKITSSVDSTVNCEKITSVKNRYSVYFCGIKIPLGKKEEGDICKTTSSMLIYNDVTLPLGIITDFAAITSPQKKELNERQQLLLCSYHAFLDEIKLMENSETERKAVNIEQNHNSTKITISYTNHETSGIEYYFVVEDNELISNNAQ